MAAAAFVLEVSASNRDNIFKSDFVLQVLGQGESERNLEIELSDFWQEAR